MEHTYRSTVPMCFFMCRSKFCFVLALRPQYEHPNWRKNGLKRCEFPKMSLWLELFSATLWEEARNQEQFEMKRRNPYIFVLKWKIGIDGFFIRFISKRFGPDSLFHFQILPEKSLTQMIKNYWIKWKKLTRFAIFSDSAGIKKNHCRSRVINW